MKYLLIFAGFLGTLACARTEAPERKTVGGESGTVAEQPVSAAESLSKPVCTIDFTIEKLPIACAKGGQYQAVFFNDIKSGYAISGRFEKDGVVQSCEFSHIVMKRGDAELTIASVVNMVETTDGIPLSYQMISDGAGMQKQSCGVVKDDKVVIRTLNAGQESVKTRGWPDDVLLQEGIRLLMKKQDLSAGMQLQARGFDVEGESVVSFDYLIKERTNVDLLGKVTPSIEIETTATQDASSIVTTEWLTDDLVTLKSRSNVMGMRIETIQCEKEYALQDNSPAEVFSASFLDSPRILRSKELAGGIEYGISATESRQLDFPESAEQSVRLGGDFPINLSVTPKKLPAGGSMPYGGEDSSVQAYLKSNAWIQSSDRRIVALAKEAVGDESSPARAAKKIEQFVSSYISNRSLSVGYASALEVLESRQGDCTEFALLTAALCRAVGIPARVVFGVVYVNSEFEGRRNFFGGHAWTQVYLQDGWYSLDAAMGQFDAGHIAIDFNDGEPSNFFRLITIMGYFRIDAARAQKAAARGH